MSRNARHFLLALLLGLGGIAGAMAAPAAWSQSSADAAKKEYEETVRKGDELLASGNAFEAVRQYESAWRIAYNNKLNVDLAELEKKKAAAQKARDEKQNQKAAAPTPAPAPGPQTATGTGAAGTASAKPAPTGAAQKDTPQTPMQEYEAWMQYADGLMAAGEYRDAVRAYERAALIARNNNLHPDKAAWEAKHNLASKADNAPKVKPTELVPPAPPPVPREPGKVDLIYAPAHEGKFLPWTNGTAPFVLRDMKATAAEVKALTANLQKINDVVKKAAMLNPPAGFDVYSSYSWYEFGAAYDKSYLARGLPLQADTFFSFPVYYERHYRSKTTGEKETRYFTTEELECGLRFHVNFPPAGESDAEKGRTFFIEPKVLGKVGGYPVYDIGKGMLVIARPGDELWVPITTEKLLKYMLPKYKSSVDFQHNANADRKKSLEKDLSAETLAKRREEIAAARAQGGRSGEDKAQYLERQYRRWEENDRKALEAVNYDPLALAAEKTYRDAKAMLDSGDRSLLDAPACVQIGKRAAFEIVQILRPGTAGCARVVEDNPKLLNPKLPRSAMQIITVADILNSTEYLNDPEWKHIREEKGNCTGVTNLIRQLDWAAIGALLAK